MIYNLKNIVSIFSITMALGLLSPVIAQNTVLPDFQGKQSEFASYRTRITNAMLEGPNFSGHYSLITIGCGTSCKFGYVGDHRTGRLFYFPFGGEEHYDMQLEFSIETNEVVASFQDNPLIETDEGWKPLYESGESPCAAVRLVFQDEKFVEVDRRSVDRFNRHCPSGADLFTLNASDLSSFEADCLSEFTRFNLCQLAQETANEAELIFPIQIDSEMSVRSMRNEGPSLVLTAIWHLSPSEIDLRLNLNRISGDQMRASLEKTGITNACNNEILSAFLRLGGILSYRYLNAGYGYLHDFDVRSENCGRTL